MEWTLIKILMMILEAMHEVLFLMHGITVKKPKNLDKNMKGGICETDRTVAFETFHYNDEKKKRYSSSIVCVSFESA